MRQVNRAYGLPNPPAWHEKVFTVFRKGVMKLRGILLLPGQQPARVSGHIHRRTALENFVDRQEYHSNQLLSRKKLPLLFNVIHGLLCMASMPSWVD